VAKIIPFRGIRPVRDKVHLVASRSVDNYGRNDLAEKLRGNPYTFLHVINPDFSEGKRSKPGTLDRLKKVRNKYLQFRNEGIFLRDQTPTYYLYQQIKLGHTYTGIIACTSIDEYFNGTIRVHEQTLTDRERKLQEYLDVCEFNAEPVLFCYPDHEGITAIIDKHLAQREEYDFTTTDKVRHRLWLIDSEQDVHAMEEYFGDISAVYIADGHHRSASSARLGKDRRQRDGMFSGNEPYNYYLGVFFPESQLKIFDFNRVVKDLNGLSTEEFISAIQNDFEVNRHGDNIFKPQQKHVFSMYLENAWYELRLLPGRVNDAEPVNSLDAFLLSKYILTPVLGIEDLKTDNRVGFVSGIKGADELKNQVDHWKFKVAFGLYPVQMQELKHIADTNNIMPPKTTWVEPKMRSGLVIFPLDEAL
jgi:uncharacterized protein (DUF1015 family)